MESPATLPAGGSVFPLQDLIAYRSGALHRVLQVLVQRLELLFLLGSEPVCLGAKQLALQLCNLGFGFGKFLVVFLCQRLQFFQQLPCFRVFHFRRRLVLK
jgi:hypothetical protein